MKVNIWLDWYLCTFLSDCMKLNKLHFTLTANGDLYCFQVWEQMSISQK